MTTVDRKRGASSASLFYSKRIKLSVFEESVYQYLLLGNLNTDRLFQSPVSSKSRALGSYKYRDTNASPRVNSDQLSK
ncbi:hypothetical protein VIBHAR_06274 [Vibrio campbellii ATCC BAA-1116]|uniref:Uncharacterized protein n=1 Tax=Vibrio campbellii (strain ATCC BAA-1116) TaxID=2902295 RepID=A7N1Z2_VIBC1|nr:hypothetical protein VIBHAR_06274 [Vibrio campbellii ATCC BAA-1116]